jgi:predicted transcriptional regulator
MKAPTANSAYTGHQLDVSLAMDEIPSLEHDDAIAFVSDPRKLQQLAPFLEEAVTVSQVAAQLALTPNAAYKLVRCLERLGLVRCTHARRRAGKPVKFYRAVAPRFRIPSSRLSLNTLSDLREAHYWKRMQRVLNRMYRDVQWRDQNWSLVLDRASRGQLFLRPFQSDGRSLHSLTASQPATLSGWIELRLTAQKAKALQRELFEVLERYGASSHGQRYLLGLFFGEERD